MSRAGVVKRYELTAVHRIVLTFCVVVASLLFNEDAVAGIEKWIDANGQVHYTDQAPPGVNAEPVEVRPNVIETDTASPTTTGERSALAPTPTNANVTAAPTPRTDIQSYIEQCRENRGVDCEIEAQQMIYGPAPVVFPGDPAVFPRPDVKPPPPGLGLKYSITP